MSRPDRPEFSQGSEKSEGAVSFIKDPINLERAPFFLKHSRALLDSIKKTPQAIIDNLPRIRLSTKRVVRTALFVGILGGGMMNDFQKANAQSQPGVANPYVVSSGSTQYKFSFDNSHFASSPNTYRRIGEANKDSNGSQSIAEPWQVLYPEIAQENPQNPDDLLIEGIVYDPTSQCEIWGTQVGVKSNIYVKHVEFISGDRTIYDSSHRFVPLSGGPTAQTFTGYMDSMTLTSNSSDGSLSLDRHYAGFEDSTQNGDYIVPVNPATCQPSGETTHIPDPLTPTPTATPTSISTETSTSTSTIVLTTTRTATATPSVTETPTITSTSTLARTPVVIVSETVTTTPTVNTLHQDQVFLPIVLNYSNLNNGGW